METTDKCEKCTLDEMEKCGGFEYNPSCCNCTVLPDTLMRMLGLLSKQAEQPGIGTERLIQISREMRAVISTLDTEAYKPYIKEANRAMYLQGEAEALAELKKRRPGKKSWGIFS